MKRFPASINCEHRSVLSYVMDRTPVGGGVSIVLTAAEDLALRQLAGALNDWATRPGGCDQALMEHAEIPAGDYNRRLFSQEVGVIDVFPFRVPPPPYGASGVLYMSASENPSIAGAAPWLRRMTVSVAAGDMTAPLFSDAKQPSIYVRPGVDFQVGTLLFCNLLLTEQATPGTTGTGFSIVWP